MMYLGVGGRINNYLYILERLKSIGILCSFRLGNDEINSGVTRIKFASSDL
jgi:hypothetical protein